MNSVFRRKITYMTFLFGVLVVWVHSVNADLFGVSLPAEDFISKGAGQIAVPGFFMISSYLFFRNFTLSETFAKWKRRIRSILIPYLVWNAVYYAGYLIASRIPGLRSLTGVGYVPFTVLTVIRAVFFYAYNPAFWFIWQLIYLFVLSPVIYLIVSNKYTACIWLGLMLFLVYSGVNIHSLNPDAVFYYSLAAAAAVHLRKDTEAEPLLLLKDERPYALRRYLYGFLLVIAGVLCVYPAGWTGNSVFLVLLRALVPTGIWFMLPGTLLPEPPGYMRNSFLIYAMHFAMVRFVNKLGAAVLPHTQACALILYLAMPALVYTVVTAFAGFLRSILPEVYEVLSGGR